MVRSLPGEGAVVAMMQCAEAEKQAEIILCEAQVLARLAQKCHKVCANKGGLLNSEDQMGESIDGYLADFYSAALTHTHRLYQAVIAPNTACGLRNPRDVQRENFDRFAAEIEQVDSFVHGGKIFIRLPQLPAKINHGLTGRGGDRTKNYFLFFNRSLDESLSRLEHEIPHFNEQNITYLTVFPKGARLCPDCENVDTKSITDTICLHTMCADSPSNTSVFMAGFQDENLRPGTYVCVSEGRFSIPEISSIIAVFYARKT